MAMYVQISRTLSPAPSPPPAKSSPSPRRFAEVIEEVLPLPSAREGNEILCALYYEEDEKSDY